MRILALILLFTSTANAGPWHYIKTHKELLASDSVLLLALSADAASTVHCQGQDTNFAHQCYESNALLGKHPGVAVTWVYTTALASAFIAVNHTLWHIEPDSPWKHLIWASPIAYGIYETLNVRANITTAENLKIARARLK